MPIDDIDNLLQQMEPNESSIEVIKALLSPTNVIMHTEIPNPPALTKLNVIVKLFVTQKYYRCALRLLSWNDNFVLNMVSYERKRAGEIERTVSSVNAANSQQTIQENRWFGGGGKEMTLSPVWATILMVGITIVLAAILYVMVMVIVP